MSEMERPDPAVPGGGSDSGLSDVWAARRQAHIRLLVASRLAMHPPLMAVVAARSAALTVARGEAEVDCWASDTVDTLGHALACLPSGLGRRPWLRDQLLARVAAAWLTSRPRVGLDAGVPNVLLDWVHAADAGVLTRDAASAAHLTADVTLPDLPDLQPVWWYELTEGRGTDGVLRAIDTRHAEYVAALDRWRDAAAAAVRAASSLPRPILPKRGDGDLVRWADWWYRHAVVGEAKRAIAAAEFGVSSRGEPRSRAYVRERIAEVAALL
jgi:hypothetical protein